MILKKKISDDKNHEKLLSMQRVNPSTLRLIVRDFICGTVVVALDSYTVQYTISDILGPELQCLLKVKQDLS